MSQNCECAKPVVRVPVRGLELALDQEAIQGAGGSCCPILTENLDLYVSPEGDDANDGITLLKAMKTIQAALERTAGYARSRYAITINIMAGEYTEYVAVNMVRHYPNLILSGESKETTKIVGCLEIVNGGDTKVKNICIESTVKYGVKVWPRSNVSFENIHCCGNYENGSIFCINYARAYIKNMTFSTKKRANACISSTSCGVLDIDGSVEFQGCDTVNSFFVQNLGNIFLYGNREVTGTSNGRKYYIKTGGVISTGRNANYLPGNTAGVVESGGVYA